VKTTNNSSKSSYKPKTLAEKKIDELKTLRQGCINQAGKLRKASKIYQKKQEEYINLFRNRANELSICSISQVNSDNKSKLYLSEIQYNENMEAKLLERANKFDLARDDLEILIARQELRMKVILILDENELNDLVKGLDEAISKYTTRQKDFLTTTPQNQRTLGQKDGLGLCAIGLPSIFWIWSRIRFFGRFSENY